MNLQNAAYVREVVRRAKESVLKIETELRVLHQRSPLTAELQHLIWSLEIRLVEAKSKAQYPLETLEPESLKANLEK